jgi:uncharacterized repeat protein (TIGR03803 family)
MTRLSAWKQSCATFLLCAATAIAAQGQTFNTLIAFGGPNGGSPGFESLAQGIDGNLYGTTYGGGKHTAGTVFKMTPSGKLTTLHSFCIDCTEGLGPNAGLVLGTDGNFYGTTSGGGKLNYGTVFKITPGGTLTTLHSFVFSDGEDPSAALVQGTDGNFYGTTFLGGSTTQGTIFKITPEGTLTTLHAFAGRPTDGANPYGALVLGTDGDFYGTTEAGGAAGGGTVFRITPGGAVTTLYSFCPQGDCSDGESPYAGLVQGADGNFYGTTTAGGTNCSFCGTIFKITAAGDFAKLHDFGTGGGSFPAGTLIQGTDGNFYGTTVGDLANGLGTVFEITPTGTLTTLHTFNGSTDGSYAYGGLVQATSGTFYGTTSAGVHLNCDPPHGCGTVFSLATDLGPFVSLVHNPAKVGQPFGILGQGFNGTTNVSLNGNLASFSVKSETLILATVPPGATTGFVTVMTPSGTLTSNVPFRVIR